MEYNNNNNQRSKAANNNASTGTDSGQQPGQHNKSGPGANSNGNTNQNKRNNNNNNNNNKGRNNQNNKFTGHTQDLKGYVITDDEGQKSAAQQFNELQDRLTTYAATNYSAEVGMSMLKLTTMTKKDFMPTRPKADEWSEPELDSRGSVQTNVDGSIRMIVDKETKAVLMDMYNQQIKDSTKEMSEYKKGLKAMFRTILGQVSPSMQERLKSHTDWDDMERANDSIRLLGVLRDLCYQNARTKVHRATNLLRANRKLVCSRQRDDDCAAYVKEVQEWFEVYKSVGGWVVCPELISCLAELRNDITLERYIDMPAGSDERKRYDDMAEQLFIATIVIEGSDSSSSILRETLQQQYALGTDMYPTNPSRALEMLNEFKNTKKGGGGNRRGNNRNNNNGKQGNKTSNQQAQESNSFVNKGSQSTAAPASSPDTDLTARQVLMAGIASGENFNQDSTCFFQHGVATTNTASEASSEGSDHSFTVSSHVSRIEDNSDDEDWAFWEDNDNSDRSIQYDIDLNTTTMSNGTATTHVSSNDHDIHDDNHTAIASHTAAASIHTIFHRRSDDPCSGLSVPNVVISMQDTPIKANKFEGNKQDNDPERNKPNPTYEGATVNRTPDDKEQPTQEINDKSRTKQPPDPPGHFADEVIIGELSAISQNRPDLLNINQEQLHAIQRYIQYLPHRQNYRSGGKSLASSDKPTPKSDLNFAYSNNIKALLAQSRGGIDQNWILLDSESSVNVVVNKSLLTNIRHSPNNTTMHIHCNAGTATANMVGDLEGVGTVWYYPDGIANVLSLALISDRFRVTMDTGADNAFHVHKHDGESIRFHRGQNDLYYMDISSPESTLLTIATVGNKQDKYSDADCRRAERAAKLQEIVMFPGDADFLKMLDSKTLANCKVTRRDFRMARDIYGRNEAIIKGRTTRRQPEAVEIEITDVPRHILKNYGDVTLCVDIFYVNGIRFITSISKHIKFRTARAITNMRRSTITSALEGIVGIYSARGFTVKMILADNQFNCVEEDMMRLSPPIRMNITAANEHQPHVERSNQTIKERIRCGFHSVPFSRMPPRMVAELVYACVFWLNSICVSSGVSPTLSQREIITGVSLDYNLHARFQFGDYILTHHDATDNSMAERATSAIYLRPSGNVQGGFFAFNLTTGKRIHVFHATLKPMTQIVIDRVHEIAKRQGAPTGITLADGQGNTTIHDLDTEENYDDDDASDESYRTRDNMDSESVGSNLSGVSEATEIHIDAELGPPHEPTDDHSNDDTNGSVAGPVHEPPGDGEPEARNDLPANALGRNPYAALDDGNSVDESAAEVTVQEYGSANDDDRSKSMMGETGGNEQETEPHSNDDSNKSGEQKEQVESENDGEWAEVPPRRRTGLRPVVRRTHNKFGAGEGYHSSTHHRANLFSAGLASGVKELVRREIGYMCIAAAINQYNNLEATQVTKQYGVRQGIKIFGDDGIDAVLKELKQLHDRVVVTPVDPNTMSDELKANALPYLMFLKRKRCGSIKGRGCADGRRQREFISREEASSPTVSLHALILSCMIDAIEGRDVATADIPGAFLQTDMPEDEIVHIRLDGTMAELLCRLDPNLYAPCMITRGRTKVLYAKANKAIYGTLRAALLFWENLSGALTEWGFKANPYDRCTMNKMINGHQCTICWHVDDLKISHVDSKVVDSVLEQLNERYGRISPLTVTRGKVHDYVGMTLDFSQSGEVRFSMFDYLEEIIQNLPESLRGEAQTPASDHLFVVDEENAEKLNDVEGDKFHHYVAKLLFMAKRTRPDIQTAVAFLCTRVKSPDVHDWKKLARVMKYLQVTPFLPLVLGWDGSGIVRWYVDASFAVHKDMRSHTGGLMTMGKGGAICMSTKQKINTKSSTEAGVVGVDDVLNVQVWTRYFLNAQYEHCGKQLTPHDILYQDNTSAIKLEKNGKASSTKRTRHIDIRYFFITDRVKSGDVGIEYCPTEEMIGDFFTKPLQGSLFKRHRNSVLGISETEYDDLKINYYSEKSKRNTSS